MESKGYRIFDDPDIDWNLNIVGIRARNLEPNEFDDLLVVFHRFLGEWTGTCYPITTDPSPHFLKNPPPPVDERIHEGVAILVPGQYESTYEIGMHRGEYEALCQRGDLEDADFYVSVYRDNTRDGTLHMDPATIQTGPFRINIHKAARNGEWDPYNTRYSRGCQVFADDRHFEEFMQKCNFSRQARGENIFTYTLLLEQDFN